MENQTLHQKRLEERLSVLEHLASERNSVSASQHSEILTELKEVRREISKLKVNLAFLSATVATVTSLSLKKIFATFAITTALVSPVKALGHGDHIKMDVDIERVLEIPIKPQSLVYIEIDEMYSCSGFIVKEGYVVTAGHCVTPPRKSIKVLLADGKFQTFTLYKASIPSNENSSDWAILKGPTDHLKPLSLSKVPFKPQMGLMLSARAGDREAVPCVVLERTNLPDGGHKLVLGGHVIPGDSGSPLVGERGEVLGIVVQTLTDSDPHTGLAMDIDAIVKELP